MDSLIRQAKDGDAEAIGVLWEETRKFALAVSRRFHATVSVDADDLQQCAWLGFHAAVQRYEARYHFLTLLDYCVRIECQQALHIRTSKRDLATVSYDIPAPDGEQAMLDLFEDDSCPNQMPRSLLPIWHATSAPPLPNCRSVSARSLNGAGWGTRCAPYTTWASAWVSA